RYRATPACSPSPLPGATIPRNGCSRQRPIPSSITHRNCSNSPESGRTTTAPASSRGRRFFVEDSTLLRSADAADGGAAIGALALRDGLAVLRRALDGILHDLLGLALHTIRFNSHDCKTPLCPV